MTGACRSVCPDGEVPSGGPCMFYTDGKGGTWLLVNRQALHEDPEWVVEQIAKHTATMFMPETSGAGAAA